MESINLTQMESITGGAPSCSEGAGYATGFGVVAVAVAVATGPIAITAVGLGFILGASGFGAAAVLNCIT